MAFYQFSEESGNLLQLSDLPISPDTGMPVAEVPITKSDILEHYQWDVETRGFVVKVQRILTKKDFLKRFTPQEYIGIKSAAQANGNVDYYWQLFMLAEEINLDDPDTVSGLNLLVYAGLLQSDRVQQILL